MLAYSDLRNELVRLLAQEVSLDNFEDWFVQQSWNIHKVPDLRAQQLAYAIEIRLAEYGNDDLSEAQLRQELLNISQPIHLSMPELESGTATSFSFTPWVVPSSGKALVVAYE
jgi:hypothetical protein